MTQEQKSALVEAKEAEKFSLLVDLTDAQLVAANELGISKIELQAIANSSFASAMRGKVQAAIDKAIKAKYEADSRGKKEISTVLENEIQNGKKLKASL